MLELEQVLRAHAARYPRMEPCDAVKLLYQSEFGGGHLICDRKQAMLRLAEEYAEVPQEPGSPLFEKIGGGLVRVRLAALDANGVAPERLLRWFCDSAAVVRGNQKRFLEKLAVLEVLTDKDVFRFDRGALLSYLDNYALQGYPAASHSGTYRRLYAPAYRVALQDYLEEYARQNRPRVTHSEIYRQLYTPAYRVALRSLCDIKTE